MTQTHGSLNNMLLNNQEITEKKKEKAKIALKRNDKNPQPPKPMGFSKHICTREVYNNTILHQET